MTIRVLLFASYSDAVGKSEMSVILPDGSVASEVVTRLRGMAGGHSLPPNPMIAINSVYARAETALSPGDEVAIIPPVAGG